MLKILVSSLLYDFTIFKDKDTVSMLDKVKGVGYQENSFEFEVVLDGLVEEERTHVSIDCT